MHHSKYIGSDKNRKLLEIDKRMLLVSISAF